MGHIFGKRERECYERWLASPWGRLATTLESELIISALEPRPGERLLDVGCGLGTHLQLFHLKGLDVTGLDPSTEMLQAAAERLGEAVPLHLGFAEHLPFDDGAFDLCVFITSLEFVDNPALALAEAARVARRRVLVGLINPYSAHGLSCRLRSLCRSSIYGGARFFSLWRLRRLVRATLGEWPLRWRSALALPAPLCCRAPSLERWLSFGTNPFGGFLAVTIDLAYRYRLESQPLRMAEAMRGRQRLAGVGLQTGGVPLRGAARQKVAAKKTLTTTTAFC